MALCISFSCRTLADCKVWMQNIALKKQYHPNFNFMAEFRLDLMSDLGSGQMNKEDLLSCFREAQEKQIPFIATCRDLKIRGFTNERLQLLEFAVNSGAAYIDIEIESTEVYCQNLVKYAQNKSCLIIISYHNYELTPTTQDLYAITDSCYSRGGSIAKIATKSSGFQDNSRLLSLYDYCNRKYSRKCIVLGMGAFGKITRIAATHLGSPLTFVAHGEADATAPGQFTLETMIQVLNTFLSL